MPLPTIGHSEYFPHDLPLEGEGGGPAVTVHPLHPHPGALPSANQQTEVRRPLPDSRHANPVHGALAQARVGQPSAIDVERTQCMNDILQGKAEIVNGRVLSAQFGNAVTWVELNRRMEVARAFLLKNPSLPAARELRLWYQGKTAARNAAADAVKGEIEGIIAGTQVLREGKLTSQPGEPLTEASLAQRVVTAARFLEKYAAQPEYEKAYTLGHAHLSALKTQETHHLKTEKLSEIRASIRAMLGGPQRLTRERLNTLAPQVLEWLKQYKGDPQIHADALAYLNYEIRQRMGF